MTVNTMSTQNDKKIGILGVPLGFGAGKTGSELGVNAMRLSQVRGKTLSTHIIEIGYEVTDHGDVDVIRPERKAAEGENPKFLSEMVESCRNISTSLKTILERGETPVILGGDHSIAIGTFSAISSYFRETAGEVGLIWFDAHADINTPETSPSGNIHGMPLAVLLGRGSPELTGLEGFSPKLNAKFFAHVGARDVDAGERDRVSDFGVRDHFFTMSDIDKRGMLACVNDALEIASAAPGGFAVTFDVDMIHPRLLPDLELWSAAGLPTARLILR